MGLDTDDGLGDGAQQQQHAHDLVQSAQVFSWRGPDIRRYVSRVSAQSAAVWLCWAYRETCSTRGER